MVFLLSLPWGKIHFLELLEDLADESANVKKMTHDKCREVMREEALNLIFQGLRIWRHVNSDLVQNLLEK